MPKVVHNIKHKTDENINLIATKTTFYVGVKCGLKGVENIN